MLWSCLKLFSRVEGKGDRKMEMKKKKKEGWSDNGTGICNFNLLKQQRVGTENNLNKNTNIADNSKTMIMHNIKSNKWKGRQKKKKSLSQAFKTIYHMQTLIAQWNLYH